MSEPTDRHEFDPSLLPEPGGDAAHRAREQFVHALLRAQHEAPAEREARLARLGRALRADEARSRPVWIARRWHAMSGVAAAAALVALVILGFPAQQSAIAVVQASIRAQQSAGDRRYEVRVVAQPPARPGESGDAAPEERAIATVDARDSDHLLLQARTPWGDRMVVGRNPKGSWAIKPDGTIDEYPPAQAWPRWANFGTSTILLSTVEDVLKALEKSHTLTRGKVESFDGVACDRLTARREPGPSPQPEIIELWIDRGTRQIRRMELVWPSMPRPMGGEFGGREPGFRGPEGQEPRGPDGFMPRGPRPGGPPGGRPPIDGSERPPRPAQPMMDPPLRERSEARPDAPGDEPHRLPPREGVRPDPRRPMDPPGPGVVGPEMRGPGMGGPGPGMGGPPRGGRHRGPRPEFLGGPPDFADGRHPPPPRKMVFVLVPSSPFADNWFDAATHAQSIPESESDPEP